MSQTVHFEDERYILFTSDMADPNSNKGLCLNTFYLYIRSKGTGLIAKLRTRNWIQALQEYQSTGLWDVE
jgi:hypothetical protein